MVTAKDRQASFLYDLMKLLRKHGAEIEIEYILNHKGE